MILKTSQRKSSQADQGFIWSKMNKNCIIIHGSNPRDLQRMKEENLPPQNKRHWISWLKKKLEERGFEVFTPLMPRNWDPKYKDWKKEFEKVSIDENTILIGHSVGGAFVTRWVGDTKTKIKKLILVAPAKIFGGGHECFKDLCDFKINKEILDLAEIVIFISDNESEGIKKAVEIYSKELGIIPIKLKGKGHFTEKRMGTKEFPELLEEVLK